MAMAICGEGGLPLACSGRGLPWGLGVCVCALAHWGPAPA